MMPRSRTLACVPFLVLVSGADGGCAGRPLSLARSRTCRTKSSASGHPHRREGEGGRGGCIVEWDVKCYTPIPGSYPTGGDNISVTQGIVSRVAVAKCTSPPHFWLPSSSQHHQRTYFYYTVTPSPSYLSLFLSHTTHTHTRTQTHRTRAPLTAPLVHQHPLSLSADTHAEENLLIIQIDAAINSGNSG